jgi:hypothetical protein
MLSLTEEQITFIENDIKVRGITSPDLSIDLLDHICCLIENELDEYRNFDTVYQNTLLLFGEKGLKEIQDETNRLLTFKHYYFMNATMKISGYVSSLMILIGSIFKLQHWLGANVLILVGVFFLSTLFLPLLFILKFKSTDENNRNVVLSIIGFVSSILICLGILFRILHWPGSRMMIVIGCSLLILGYLPIYILSIYKNTTNKINATATIILIIAGVGLFITESGTGLSRATSDSFWRGVTDSNELLNINTLVSEKNYQNLFAKSINDSLKLSQLKELKTSTDEILLYTKKMKAYLISNTEEGITERQAEQINLDALRSSGYGDVLTKMLLDEKEGNAEYNAKILKSKIENYRQILFKLSPHIDLSYLKTNEITVFGEQVDWAQSNFEKLPLPLVIYNIIRIELALKAAETAAINQLQ